jgi:hypothetical protein
MYLKGEKSILLKEYLPDIANSFSGTKDSKRYERREI